MDWHNCKSDSPQTTWQFLDISYFSTYSMDIISKFFLNFTFCNDKILCFCVYRLQYASTHGGGLSMRRRNRITGRVLLCICVSSAQASDEQHFRKWILLPLLLWHPGEPHHTDLWTQLLPPLPGSVVGVLAQEWMPGVPGEVGGVSQNQHSAEVCLCKVTFFFFFGQGL